MKGFIDYTGEHILLFAETERRIAEAHPEIDFDQVLAELKDPDEVLKSSYRGTSILYYRIKSMSH